MCRSISCHITQSKHNMYYIIYQGGKEKSIVDSKSKEEIFPKHPQNKYISSFSCLLISHLKCVGRFGEVLSYRSYRHTYQIIPLLPGNWHYQFSFKYFYPITLSLIMSNIVCHKFVHIQRKGYKKLF